MKKNLPLIVLEILEKYVDKKGEEFDIIDPANFLLKAVDNDSNSGFYFDIEQYKVVTGGLNLLIDRKPHSKNSTENSRYWIKDSDLDSTFSTWVGFLKRYKTVKSFYDDPILEKFAEEYLEYFEILDEDAEKEPYKPDEILLINTHLNSLNLALKTKITEENEELINAIVLDVTEIQDNLTQKPKKWVVSRISRVWAKMSKQGPSFIEDLFTEIKKLATKEAAKGILNLTKKAVLTLIELL